MHLASVPPPGLPRSGGVALPTSAARALGHQLAVLERQLGGQKVRFALTDRAFLAVLLHCLTPEALRRMRLLVRPDRPAERVCLRARR